MSLVAALKGNGPTGFGYGSTADEVVKDLNLEGKNILITGCNSGLGLYTMQTLSQKGARIIAAARTIEKVKNATQDLSGEFLPVACELSEPTSVAKCADELVKRGEHIDVILCNAGIMALPKLQVQHGLELQFLTNHIGHFILITRLLDQLKDDGRVVLLSSSAHQMAPKKGIELDNLDGKQGYKPWRAYGQSKLANLLCARELARRFEGSHKTANAVHPGVIMTNLGRHSQGDVINFLGSTLGNALFLKSIPQGAASQTYLAAHPDAAKYSGEYFADCNVAKSSAHGKDMALAQALWEKSEEIVKDFNL